jgi:hypothetical protein
MKDILDHVVITVFFGWTHYRAYILDIFVTVILHLQFCWIVFRNSFGSATKSSYNSFTVRYHIEGSMKLNARILLLVHMVYL